jgi:hypothetical protein
MLYARRRSKIKSPMEDSLDSYLVATSEYGDDAIDSSVSELLTAIRTRLAMDVVFVSKIGDGKRTFMAVDSTPELSMLKPGVSDPLEQSWCNLVVRGRLAEVIQDAMPLIAAGAVPATSLQIGTHLSVPVRLADGSVYGTLCCFSKAVKGPEVEQYAALLRKIAELIAERLGGAKLGARAATSGILMRGTAGDQLQG